MSLQLSTNPCPLPPSSSSSSSPNFIFVRWAHKYRWMSTLSIIKRLRDAEEKKQQQNYFPSSARPVDIFT